MSIGNYVHRQLVTHRDHRRTIQTCKLKSTLLKYGFPNPTPKALTLNLQPSTLNLNHPRFSLKWKGNLGGVV